MNRHDASARVTIPAALGLVAWAWCAACAPRVEQRAGNTLPPQAVVPTAAAAPERIAIPQIGVFEVRGPFTHGNLALYVIHGSDRLAPDADVVTLHAALDRGAARKRSRWAGHPRRRASRRAGMWPRN